MELFAACAPGLEPMLLEEASRLGPARAVDGGVELEGDAEVLYRANLELGLALKVLVRVARFEARRFAALVSGTASAPWKAWLRPGPLAVKATATRSRLFHTGAIAERIREGVATALGGDVREPDDATAGEEGPHAGEAGGPPGRGAWMMPVLQVRIVDDQVTLSIDSSGEPLHRRGYRLATGKAPLREDVARALIIASGWDRASPLIDPCCGAGTILVEAAYLARRIPPGHARRFAFMDAPDFDAARWQRVHAHAMAEVIAAAPLLHGSDRDPGAIEAATANLARAGVSAELAVAPLSAAPAWASPPARGAVITNPPWGQRTGKEATLRNLYQSLGTRVRALPGYPAAWAVALVTADPRLGGAAGLDLDTAIRTDHGGTRVHLMTGSGGKARR